VLMGSTTTTVSKLIVDDESSRSRCRMPSISINCTFMPSLPGVPTVSVYDNEYVWVVHEIERTMVTQETRSFLNRFEHPGG
jgi:hypothetical protein